MVLKPAYWRTSGSVFRQGFVRKFERRRKSRYSVWLFRSLPPIETESLREGTGPLKANFRVNQSAGTPPLQAAISVAGIEAAARSIDPVFLNTPQFESEPLSNELGMRLVLKVETVNPIRCFKGRGADWFVSRLPPSSSRLVCASAGNFGQGLAYAARKRAFPLLVFAAETANPLKIWRMRQLGAEVRLFGHDFDAAKQEARRVAEETGAHFVEDGREPAVTEGAGTIAVELCRWPSRFDFALVPLGNGALLGGIAHWLKAHSPDTRVVGVCASGAPAMALSLRQHGLQSTDSVSTIADGIAVRVPVPEALVDLDGVVDEVLLVEDEALIQAMRLIFEHHGLIVEPAGVAGLAAAIAYRERFRDACVATPLCGGNVTADQVGWWFVGN
jgi:threonine dehydratase